MDEKIKVLILEDVIGDLELVLYELRRAELKFTYLHVETEEDFTKGLTEFKPDIILSDYNLPQFNGMEALEITKEVTPLTPFVIVTGSLNEETAVQCLKSGAWDYVIKENLIRIGSAVNQAIERKALIDARSTAEKALRKSEKKYRQLYESNRMPISIYDTETLKFLSVNNAFVDKYGYTKKEFLKMTILDIRPESEIEQLVKSVKKIDNGLVNAGVYLHKKKNGKIIHVEIIRYDLVYEGKNAKLVFANDITERKQAEDKEKEHHRNIELIYETAMKFVEFQQDENIYTYIGKKLRDYIGEGSFIIVNSVDEEAHSSTIQAVLGMGKFTEKISKLFGRHPVGMTIDVEDPNIHYADGKLHRYEKGIHGLSFRTVPKTICDSIEKLLKIKKIYVIDLAKQEHFFGNVIILLKDDANALKNKQVIETFIKQASIAVQKRQAEKELVTSEAQLSDAMQIAKLGYWEYDIDADLFTFNDHFYNIFKTTVEKVGSYQLTPDQYVEQFLYSDDRELVAHEMQKAFTTTDPNFNRQIEHRIIYADGEIGFISVRFFIVKDKQGRTIKIFGANQDITERKQAEEQIKQDLREKNVLLQEIYHRTKNSMQVIISILKMKSRETDSEFIHTTFKEVINKINAMSMVHQKLYQAKDLSKINLKDYIEDLVHMLQQSYSLQLDDVVVKFELEDVFVLIDSAVPMGLILNELISNIFKHAFPNNETGEISIRLYQGKNGAINIYLGDNGIGLPNGRDLRKDHSMGLNTVFSLIEYQLKGEVTYQVENGLKWHLKFRNDLDKVRI